MRASGLSGLAFLPVTAMAVRSASPCPAAWLAERHRQPARCPVGGWGFMSSSGVSFPTPGLAGIWTLTRLCGARLAVAVLRAGAGLRPPGSASRSSGLESEQMPAGALSAPQRMGGGRRGPVCHVPVSLALAPGSLWSGPPRVHLLTMVRLRFLGIKQPVGLAFVLRCVSRYTWFAADVSAEGSCVARSVEV